MHSPSAFLNYFVFIAIIASSVICSLLTGASGEGNKNTTITQPCVTPVDETLPRCRITFREEGSFGAINATCLENNVFVISPNRTRPRTSDTKDASYFSSIFDSGLPPYARIVCSATFPMEFDFEGVGALDFFRVWKQQRHIPNGPTNYSINAEVMLSPEATGRYVFRSANNPEVRTSFFIFSERGIKPYLIGGGARTILGTKLNDTATLIPCVASDLAANVTLFKRVDDAIWIKVRTPERIPYDRQRGFILYPVANASGEYRCFTTEEDSTNVSSDFVTVHVKEPLEDNRRPTKLTLEILTNTTAVCYSTENGTNLKFSNAYARNPTEARLLESCLQKKSSYCGTHSYHLRIEGREIEGSLCPKNAPYCSWITNIHSEGAFYCETSDGSESITQEYFTGLDGKIYTNYSAVPSNFLLKPVWKPNVLALKTGTLYDFSCEAVGFLFLKDPFTISVKYKNGTVEKLGDIVWWQGTRSYYLTTEMVEIICSDTLWKTNEQLDSGVKVVVTEKECDHDQFRCRNAQCIREAWRCDGDNDCADNTDEMDCHTHRCKFGHFKCTNALCIPNDKKCNNKNDCLDGSDESLELCANMTCTVDEFKCQNGQCTPAHFLCDGDTDCFDKSDETVEHCSKYYPQFTQTRTHVTFTPNSINELVCKTSLLPIRLRPTLAWWRRGENISDPERLWQDKTGLKLSLRFDNVSADDGGEYTCVAINKMQRVVQVFTVEVQLPESDLSCHLGLSSLQCMQRGCVLINNTCTTIVEPTQTETATTSATTAGQERSGTETTTSTSVTESSPIQHHSVDTGKTSSGGSGVTIAIVFLVVIIALGLGVLAWRNYTRRHVPIGSARMREDHEVILGGI